MKERITHLKNLIRHSTEAKLVIYNPLLDNAPCSESIQKRRNEISEALEFLKQNNVKITKTPYGDEYTIIHLKSRG